MDWLKFLLGLIVCAAVFSPVEGAIYLVLTHIKKRPASLFITVPAACLVAFFVLLAIAKWGRDSNGQEEEFECALSDIEISRISASGAEMWYCGDDRFMPCAVAAILTDNGRLTIRGKGAMDDFSYHAPWGISYGEFGHPYGYMDYSSITDAVIENGVTRIGEKAFFLLKNLASVTIPNSVKSIGSAAFAACESLASITIPGSVDTIGAGAFNFCVNLNTVVISNGVTAIGKEAFLACTSLKSVTIPGSVATIGEKAFLCCYGLTSVNISNGVTTIGEEAFYACTSLKSVTIPSSVATISPRAFTTSMSYDCDDPVITVAKDNAHYSSEDGILFNKNKTVLIRYPNKRDSVYTIPSGVTAIGDDAFRGCGNLTSVIIHDKVKSIGAKAFAGCNRLTSVAIPGSVTRIGDRAFSSCDNLKTVMIEEGVSVIGYAAFEDCEKLTSITIPKSVTLIKTAAFVRCKKLTSVTILNRIPPEIVYGTFDGFPAKACLYVPKCAVGDYRSAEEWDEFKCVKPIAAEAADAPDCASDSAEAPGMFTDKRDGKRYKTALIGGKRWMAKNLNYKTNSSWCYGDNDIFCKIYGRMYAWNTAKTACPQGWHLPSRKEWIDLVHTAGGEMRCDDKDDIYWCGDGKKLKARTGWEGYFEKDSGNGTDDYGFSALPGGNRNPFDGSFDNARQIGDWWTAAEYDSAHAYRWYMTYHNNDAREYQINKLFAINVRCVEDGK